MNRPGGAAYLGLLVLRRGQDVAAPELFAQVRKPARRQHAVAEALERYQRFLEAVGLGQVSVAHVASSAHVPLPEVGGGIAGALQDQPDARRGGVQVVGHATLPVPLP